MNASVELQFLILVQILGSITGQPLKTHGKLMLLFSTQDEVAVMDYAELDNQSTTFATNDIGRKKRYYDQDSFVLSSSRMHGLVCELCIMMDAQFVMAHGSEELEQKLREMVANVSWIFRATDWNYDGMPDNIGFAIREVRKGWQLVPNEKLEDYYIQQDATELLRSFGRDNYAADCCLAVALTMKPFKEFRAAISLIASSKVMGGICENRVADPTENITSMNLVLISGRGPDEWNLDLEQVGMVLLHELGHSFGSRHDNSLEASQGTVDDERMGRLITLRECSGYRPRLPIGDTRLYARRQVVEPPNGRFIMWGQSIAGKKAFRLNNFRFSNCSRRSVAQVIQSGRTACFVKDPTPFCGNGILEESEECDCGAASSCEKLKCCGSRISSSPCKILVTNEPCLSLAIYNSSEIDKSGPNSKSCATRSRSANVGNTPERYPIVGLVEILAATILGIFVCPI